MNLLRKFFIKSPSILEEKNKLKDFSLYSGERQTGENISQIRFDHLARYEIVLNFLNKCSSVDKFMTGLDLFCGNGYGTYILTNHYENLHLIGIDGSREAIEQANNSYSQENNIFAHKLFPFKLPRKIYDLIICFESLEHIENDIALFNELVASLNDKGNIFISVPNQAHHDLDKNPHKFHYRHYLHESLLKMTQEKLKLIEFYGQNVYHFNDKGICTFSLLSKEEMIPLKGTQGQVNIYHLEKTG